MDGQALLCSPEGVTLPPRCSHRPQLEQLELQKGSKPRHRLQTQGGSGTRRAISEEVRHVSSQGAEAHKHRNSLDVCFYT